MQGFTALVQELKSVLGTEKVTDKNVEEMKKSLGTSASTGDFFDKARQVVGVNVVNANVERQVLENMGKREPSTAPVDDIVFDINSKSDHDDAEDQVAKN